MGPNQSTTACTSSGWSALAGSGPRRAAESPEVPAMAARLPPAESPQRATREPSSPYSPACARTQRTAALTSLTAAGKCASGLSR